MTIEEILREASLIAFGINKRIDSLERELSQVQSEIIEVRQYIEDALNKLRELK